MSPLAECLRRYTSLFPTVEYVASVAAVLGSPKVKCPLEAEGFEMINASCPLSAHGELRAQGTAIEQ